VQGDSSRSITGYLTHGKDADLKTTEWGEGCLRYGPLYKDTVGGGSMLGNNIWWNWYPIDLDIARVVPTSNEYRPINTSIKYFIRAIGG